MTTRVTVTGDREIIANLKKTEKVIWKALGKSVKQRTKGMLSAAKARAPTRTGLLRRSLGIKPWRKRRSRVLGVVIGARSGYKRAITKTRRGNFRAASKKASVAAGADATYADPVKYLHLVERGTRHAPARRFLEPAFVGRSDYTASQVLSDAWKAVEAM